MKVEFVSVSRSCSGVAGACGAQWKRGTEYVQESSSK